MIQSIFVKAAHQLELHDFSRRHADGTRNDGFWLILAGTVGRVVKQEKPESGGGDKILPRLAVCWPVAFWTASAFFEPEGRYRYQPDDDPTADVEIIVRASAVEVTGVDALPDPRPRAMRRIELDAAP